MKLFGNGKRRGAITIFLTIILIPTLLFSAVLIDGSRVASAKAITQEAADLAAISAIANYDKKLKKEFGMFAMDDPDNLKKLYQESLEATLMAYGFESNEEYSDKIWQLLKSKVTGKTGYSDAKFLNLYDFKADSVEVEKLYPLSEKEVLKTQMVEYSKFRGLFVITDRLGLFGHFAEAKRQADENEETSETVSEKMKIDQDNAKADQAVKELKDAVTEFQNALSALQSDKTEYIKVLDAWMYALYYETITTDEEPEDDLLELAVTYPDQKESFEDSWKALITAASNVRKKAKTVNRLSTKAVEKLKDFSEENKEGNDTEKQLGEDAEKNAEDYQKYIDISKEIEKDTQLEKLAGLKKSELKKVLDRIDEAADSDSEIRAKLAGDEDSDESEEDEEEEITECYYYYYDQKNYSTNADRIIYGNDPKMNYEAAVEAVYREYTGLSHASWTDVKLNYEDSQTTETKITKEFAEEVSGRDPESEDEGKNTAERGEIKKDYYSNLPSKQTAENGKTIKKDFYNENGDLTKSQSIMTEGKHSIIQDVAEPLRDELLCFSYMFGTFKTRLTGVEKFSSEKMSDSDKDSFYMPKWRYAHKDGEVDMRFEPKKDRKTVLRSEIEYLIYGNRTDLGNEAAVYATIYAERLANNLLALYMCKNVKSACHSAAVSASAATLGTVPEPVFFWIFLTAWSAAETALDMHYLIAGGYKIPLFKTKDNVLLSDIPSGNGLISNYGEKGIFISYEDYLLLLLLLKGEDKRMKRSMDLIEMDMRENGESDFKIAEAYTYLKADTKMSVRYLFGSVKPFSSTYEEQGYSGRISYSSSVYHGY